MLIGVSGDTSVCRCE